MRHSLRIACFGALEVLRNGSSASGFGTDKARALLVYLAVEAGRAHSRETLAGLLWSDQPEESAMHSLRQALFSLRKVLGDEHNQPPFLLIQRDTVQFNALSGAWLDVAEFDRALWAALAHYQSRSGLGRFDVRALQRAVQIYRGHFLDQFFLNGSPLFEEWALLERETFNRQALQALALLADYYEQRGEHAQARQSAGRLLELAPWEENAHGQIMRLLAMDGQWSAAQAQYVACRRVLEEQLSLQPSAQTEALFAELRLRAARNEPLPPRFPPPPNNLPPPQYALVGRSDELDFLSARLADPACRLVTVLGPGGVGKTRLALEAAQAQVGLFRDGVWLASLGSLSSIDELVPAVAEAIGFTFYNPKNPAQQLLDYLHHKSLLLLLDNYEHLLPEVDWLVGVIGGAPGVKLLVTSRLPLNLRAEHILELGGLAYPEKEAHLPASLLEEYSALALFAQASRRVDPGFSLAAESRAVLRICRLVEGSPLAIELAASGKRQQNLVRVADQIEHSLDALSTEMGDVPARHRSLRAVFQHSYGLLGAGEQEAIRRLAVFQGSFSLAAAQASMAGMEVDPALAGLVESFLLRKLENGRFEMHSLVRQFAGECLQAEPPVKQATELAIARYFASFLVERTPDLFSSRQKAALDEIHLEEENLIQAWETLTRHGLGADLAECADGLYHFYNTRSLLAKGMQLFQIAEAALEGQELPQAIVRARRGALAQRLKQYPVARQTLEASVAVFERMEIKDELGLALVWLSGVAQRDESLEASIALAQRSLGLFQSTGNTWGQAYALYQLGLAENQRGRMPEANRWLEASLELSRQTGDQRRMIGPLNILGDIAAHYGEYQAAIAYFEESLAFSRYLGDQMNTGLVLGNLGTIYHCLENYELSIAYYRQSLDLSLNLDDHIGISLAYNNMGEAEIMRGDLRKAQANFEAALAVAKELGDDWITAITEMNLGRVAIKQNRLEAASVHLIPALRLAVDNELWVELVKLLVLLGEQAARLGNGALAAELILTAQAHDACEESLRPEIESLLAGLPGGIEPRPLPELLDLLLAPGESRRS